MLGLLIKDCFTLMKQMKIMIVILVIWACIPGFAFAPFAVFYAAMLPITALAYDERSKWDELAVTMPYTVRDIVLGKYVLGALSVLAATVIAGGAQAIIGAVRGVAYEPKELIVLFITACLALVLLSVNLPFVFRLGVEKGRLAFMMLLCAGVVAGMALSKSLLEWLGRIDSVALLVIGILLVTAVAVAVSVPTSIAMFKKRKR